MLKPGPTNAPAKLQTATFGGGCFWCAEAVFQRIPGVKSVTSGFAGGTTANPFLRRGLHRRHRPRRSHPAQFDPAVISYDKLLEIFWEAHDPTTSTARATTSGTQYRSIILYSDEAQKAAAEKSKAEAGAFLLAHRDADRAADEILFRRRLSPELLQPAFQRRLLPIRHRAEIAQTDCQRGDPRRTNSLAHLFPSYAATISVSFDRAEVAAVLGNPGHFPRLESRRCHSAGSSVRPAARPARPGRAGAASAQVLYPGHVSLSFRRGPARGPSGGLHGHRHPGPLPPRPAAATSCIRWAGTPSGCRPSNTPFAPASIRAKRPRPTSRSSSARSNRSASVTIGAAKLTRPTRVISNGRNGFSSSFTTPGSIPPRARPSRLKRSPAPERT
jgi:methionine-S-sulfoxide reductase